MSNVVDFRRPKKPEPKPSGPARRSVGEFALAVGLAGVAIFLMPALWPSAPLHLLAIVNLLIAVVYVQQGPRLLAGAWIALSLGVLVAFSEASPVAFALKAAVALLG